MSTSKKIKPPPGYTVEYHEPVTPTAPPYETRFDGQIVGHAGTRRGAIEAAWLHHDLKSTKH